jgi:hypothetical protein
MMRFWTTTIWWKGMETVRERVKMKLRTNPKLRPKEQLLGGK